MRVLVVDQDSTLLEAIAHVLKASFAVDVVTNKGDCIDLLRHNEFDAIVACERLTDGSGLELLGQIAKRWPAILRIFAADRERLRPLRGRLGPFELFQTLAYPIDPRKLFVVLTQAQAPSVAQRAAPNSTQARKSESLRANLRAPEVRRRGPVSAHRTQRRPTAQHSAAPQPPAQPSSTASWAPTAAGAANRARTAPPAASTARRALITATPTSALPQSANFPARRPLGRMLGAAVFTGIGALAIGVLCNTHQHQHRARPDSAQATAPAILTAATVQRAAPQAGSPATEAGAAPNVAGVPRQPQLHGAPAAQRPSPPPAAPALPAWRAQMNATASASPGIAELETSSASAPPPPFATAPAPDGSSSGHGVTVSPALSSSTAPPRPLLPPPGTREALLLQRVEPIFPAAASNRALEGFVDMRFSITVEGSVANLSIVDSQPPEVFDRAAVEAVSAWRYEPRIVQDRAVESPAQIRLEFTRQASMGRTIATRRGEEQ